MKSLEMYFRYTSILKKLADDGDGVVVCPLFASPSRYGIDSTHEYLLYSFLRKRINLFTGSGEDGAPEISLIEALDMNYPNKYHLLEVLKELKVENSADRPLSESIQDLIDGIASVVEKEERAPHSFVDPIITTSLTYPFAGQDISEEVKKIYDNRLFAFNFALNPDNLPTEDAKSSEFDGLSEEQLCNLFEAKNFYQLDKDGIQNALQALANNYLSELGVPPCAVVFEPLEYSSSRVVYGEYDPNRGAIIMNSNVLEQFDSAKSKKDPTFAFQLMSTAIHEARHRAQFAELIHNDGGLDEKDKLIKRALEVPQSNLSQAEYLSSLDELDARNAALEFIQRNAQKSESIALMEFYNRQKNKERHNKKAEIDPKLKKYFKNIYDDSEFDTEKEDGLALTKQKPF